MVYSYEKCYTECQKIAYAKYRAKNHDSYLAYMKVYSKNDYKANSLLYRKRRVDRYYYQQECRRLCNILL